MIIKTEYLTENLVYNLLKIAGAKSLRRSVSGGFFADFAVRWKNKNIVIEVKDKLTPIGLNSIERIINISEKFRFHKFILITNEPIPKHKKQYFENRFKNLKISVSWMSMPQFAQFLGIYEKLDFGSPKTLNALQTAAVTSAFETYAPDLIGHSPTTKPIKNILNEAEAKYHSIPPEFVDLSRQFSYSKIKKMQSQSGSLKEALFIGRRFPNAIVVLSDIKNFSFFVKTVSPEILSECMKRYYQNARDLVWKHNGVLDKFIGDAVLAIFNYPSNGDTSATDAIEFCKELVALGNSLSNELKATINELIESGTRIGISNGELWPLNLSSDGIEISFVGDVINLASRLEQMCAIDGILMDNKTKRLLDKTNPAFIAKLKLKTRDLNPEDLKGQIGVIRSWQMPPLANI